MICSMISNRLVDSMNVLGKLDIKKLCEDYIFSKPVSRRYTLLHDNK